MASVLASLGCLVFVWGLPLLAVYLLVKMLMEVRAERRAKAARREQPDDAVWPPPPDRPDPQ